MIDLLTPVSGMQIEPSRCLHRRFSRTVCRACAEVCPNSALTLDRDPHIDPALCTVCRRCEAACPTGCLQGDDRDIATLAVALARVAEPILGCHEPGVQAHARTGCLGFLDAEALLALCLVLPKGLTLNLTRCHGCRNAGVVDALQGAAAALRDGACAANIEALRLVEKPEELHFSEVDLSRRGFFTLLRTRSADTVQKAAQRLQGVPQPAVGNRKTLPARRQLLLHGLTLAPGEVSRSVAQALFAKVEFTAMCSACTGCIGICPTGAIQPAGEDGCPPVFAPGLCVACGSCQAFCRKQGVQVTAAPGLMKQPTVPAAPA